MKQITCPHCADTYPDFDVAHVCSRGPYAPRLKLSRGPRLKPKMNERIQELAEQAGIHFHKGGTLDAGPNGIAKFVLYSDIEKFAELIVKECARAIINDRRLNDVRSAANGCVRTINEHFGVNE